MKHTYLRSSAANTSCKAAQNYFYQAVSIPTTLITKINFTKQQKFFLKT